MAAHRLAPDATAIGDGGGRATAAARPVEGAEQVARYRVDLAAQADERATLLERSVNGQPGLAILYDGVVVAVLAFEVVGEKITRIWGVRNPEKLRAWTVDPPR